jgi:hypothetical protein
VAAYADARVGKVVCLYPGTMAKGAGCGVRSKWFNAGNRNVTASTTYVYDAEGQLASPLQRFASDHDWSRDQVWSRVLRARVLSFPATPLVTSRRMR